MALTDVVAGSTMEMVQVMDQKGDQMISLLDEERTVPQQVFAAQVATFVRKMQALYPSYQIEYEIRCLRDGVVMLKYHDESQFRREHWSWIETLAWVNFPTFYSSSAGGDLYVIGGRPEAVQRAFKHYQAWRDGK